MDVGQINMMVIIQDQVDFPGDLPDLIEERDQQIIQVSIRRGLKPTEDCASLECWVSLLQAGSQVGQETGQVIITLIQGIPADRAWKCLSPAG